MCILTNLMNPEINDHVNLKWLWNLWDSNWWSLWSNVWLIKLYPLKLYIYIYIYIFTRGVERLFRFLLGGNNGACTNVRWIWPSLFLNRSYKLTVKNEPNDELCFTVRRSRILKYVEKMSRRGKFFHY